MERNGDREGGREGDKERERERKKNRNEPLEWNGMKRNEMEQKGTEWKGQIRTYTHGEIHL